MKPLKYYNGEDIIYPSWVDHCTFIVHENNTLFFFQGTNLTEITKLIYNTFGNYNYQKIISDEFYIKERECTALKLNREFEFKVDLLQEHNLENNPNAHRLYELIKNNCYVELSSRLKFCAYTIKRYFELFLPMVEK